MSKFTAEALAKKTEKRGWWHGLDVGEVAEYCERLANAILDRHDLVIIAHKLSILYAENEKLREQTRWRSVEEELPDEGCEVFFWWDGLDSCYRGSLAKYEGNGFFWVYEMNREAAKKITHWKPFLFEPPEQADD